MSYWITGSIIVFDDNGEAEMTVLHQGTQEECEKVAAMVPAVTYSGPRPIRRVFIGAYEMEDR